MSEIRATTISDAAGTGPIDLHKQSAAKVWVQFDGSPVGIRESLNVASITDNGVGDYTPNLTNAFVIANYSFCINSDFGASLNNASAPTVSSVRMYTYNTTTAVAADRDYVSVVLFGELA